MRRLLILLLVLLPAPVSAQVYTSAKTIIEAAGASTFLDTNYVRVMPVVDYVFDAGHDAVNDVQAFEVVDDASTAIAVRDGFCVAGYPNWCRQKLTNRSAPGGVFDARDTWFPWLTDARITGLVAFVYDRDCGESDPLNKAQLCRTGATHPLLFYVPISATLLNQPLLIQWSDGADKILNASDPDPDNWVVGTPTVRAVLFDPIFLADSIGVAFSAVPKADGTGSVGTGSSGTPALWKRYVPENGCGAVELSHFNIASNLQYVMFECLYIDGWKRAGFPDDIGYFETNGCDWCIFKNVIGAGDLRSDRGKIREGYVGWTSATNEFLANMVPTNVDGASNSESGSIEGVTNQWPGVAGDGAAGSSSTSSLAVAYLNSHFQGYRDAGTQAAEQLFSLKTLWSNIFDSSFGFNNEYNVFYQSGIFNTPNHGMTWKALPSREATFHFQDSIACEAQDWFTADSNLSVNGLEEFFAWHSVFCNGINSPVADTNSFRLNRVRQQFVFLDNAVAWNKIDSCSGCQPGSRILGQIPRALVTNGTALVDYSAFYWWRTFTVANILSIHNPIAENNDPTNPASSDYVAINATNEVRVRVTALRSVASGTSIVNRWLLDKTSGGGHVGNIEYRLETDAAGEPSGSICSGSVATSAVSTAPTFRSISCTLSAAITEGQSYNFIVKGDATYRADYTASAGVRRVDVVTALSTFSPEAFVWDGAAWQTSSKKFGYMVGFDDVDQTPAAWITESGHGANNIVANPTWVDPPTYTATYAQPSSLPNPGNFANKWGLNVIVDSLGTLRSLFQPDTGSPLIDAASDGTNIGISGGSSEPTDPNEPPPPPSNTAPVANAGPDLSIDTGGVGNLNGAISDDGLPDGTLTALWEKVSGPGEVSFGGSQTSAAAFVGVGADGGYVFRLTASDGLLTHNDTMTLTVGDLTPNSAPVVTAGEDLQLRVGCHVLPGATASDDGLDVAYTLTWTVTTLPTNTAFSAPTFVDDNALEPTVCFYGMGTYVLTLTGDDTALTDADTRTVVVRGPNTQRRYRFR